ncbi:MAG: hypothetical protein QY323_04305 [Patescibacteria group bacterium]|nr:MAG: hypothetical protein QY323_04305 [Patescibacteria group bacterium]
MRATNEEDDIRDDDGEQEAYSRTAPSFRAYGRLPTAEDVAAHRVPTEAAKDEGSGTSLQCSKITIGLGQIRGLNRKKRERFLCIELGLDELLESDEVAILPWDVVPQDADETAMLDPEIGAYVHDDPCDDDLAHLN